MKKATKKTVKKTPKNAMNAGYKMALYRGAMK